jgi:hypothetical protein
MRGGSGAGGARTPGESFELRGERDKTFSILPCAFTPYIDCKKRAPIKWQSRQTYRTHRYRDGKGGSKRHTTLGTQE